MVARDDFRMHEVGLGCDAEMEHLLIVFGVDGDANNDNIANTNHDQKLSLVY